MFERLPNVFISPCVQSTWLLRWARVNRKEMILNCRIMIAVEKEVCLVCACWLVYRGLSFKSRRHVNYVDGDKNLTWRESIPNTTDCYHQTDERYMSLCCVSTFARQRQCTYISPLLKRKMKINQTHNNGIVSLRRDRYVSNVSVSTRFSMPRKTIFTHADCWRLVHLDIKFDLRVPTLKRLGRKFKNELPCDTIFHLTGNV